MMWDEAEAQGWLEERFWKNYRYNREKFLWLPKKNAQTGKRMWLCKAVEATSGWVEQTGGAELEYQQTRWYKSEELVRLLLKKR